MELRILIEFVSDRTGTNIVYDDETGAKRITLRTPSDIPASSLPALLESALRIKGLALADGGRPGWKQIVPAQRLANVSVATTRPLDQIDAEAVTQFITLKHITPAAAEPAIKPFLTEPGGSCIVLPEQSGLIITDYKDNLSRILDLLRMFDVPRQELAVEFVPVAQLDVAEIAPQLSQLLQAEARLTGQVEPGVEVAAHAPTNRLILLGAPGRVQRAAQIARSLDAVPDFQTVVYRFQYVAPDRVDRLARAMIGPVAAKRLYRSTIDREGNLLIVGAPATIQEQVADLTRQLDVTVTAEQSPVRFVQLTNTTAAEVLQTLQAISGTSGGAESPIAPGTRRRETDPAETPSESPAYGAVAGTTSSTASAVTGDAASAAPVAPEMPAQPTRSSAPATVRTDDAVITADPNTNTIIIAADLATQTKYEQLIRRLDKRRPQVLVECTLVTIDTSGDFSLGVELSQLSDIGSTQMLLFSAFGLSRPDVSTGNLALQPGTGFNGTIISNDVARAVVRALSGNRRVRVLSAPKLLVYDNANGTLASVAEAPFTSVNASNTVSTTSFAGYASAGTSIRITPHISDGDHLQLDYSIQLNAFTSEAANGIPPARKTDALASRIMIPDGATVIVGGLNQARQSESRQGVPFLSDIPILGYAFGTNSISQSNSTLFVFIRPIILRDDKFADLKLLSNRDVEAAQINPDLPTLEPLTVQ